GSTQASITSFVKVGQLADPVRSVPPRGSGRVDASALKLPSTSFFKVGQLITLTIENVVDRRGNTLLIP
ncbi:MAG: hypothetical protein WAL47_14225, partial [Pyrinomonadaceae bacterium]